MKNKLREITINGSKFLYSVTHKYAGCNDDVASIKIFLKGHKLTPLIIEFTLIVRPVSGNPLFSGTHLFNIKRQEKDYVNINTPSFVKECILFGFSKGWNGENKVGTLDGIIILNGLGYDTSAVLAKENGVNFL